MNDISKMIFLRIRLREGCDIGYQRKEIEIKANIGVKVKKKWLRIQIEHWTYSLDKIKRMDNPRSRRKLIYDNMCKTWAWLDRHNWHNLNSFKTIITIHAILFYFILINYQKERKIYISYSNIKRW